LDINQLKEGGSAATFFTGMEISADKEYQQIRVLRVGVCADMCVSKKIRGIQFVFTPF
jgi:hypothetical protein